MNGKIKILFISPHVVNSHVFQAGHQSFSYYLNRFCNDDKFEVGYVVTHKNDDDYNKMREQFSNAKNFSVAIPRYVRLFTWLYYNSILRNLFAIIKPDYYFLDPIRAWYYKNALEKVKNSQWIPDVVNFEWTEVLSLLEKVKKIFPDSATVVMEHDVSFKKLNRQYSNSYLLKRFFLPRFKKYELNKLNKVNLILVLSKSDRNLLIENRIEENKIFLISPFYQNSNLPQSALKRQIIFFGAMGRMENLDAVEWFINNVFVPYKLYNDVSFTVIGGGVSKTFTDKFTSIQNLNFTGFVKKPQDYFESALCMVVPLNYGGGIKIKILEAMSNSVTVLTNDIGIEGIDATNGLTYIHCSTPDEYKSAIVQLYSNPDRALEIGEQSRLMVNDNYDYEKSYLKYKGWLCNQYTYNKR